MDKIFGFSQSKKRPKNQQNQQSNKRFYGCYHPVSVDTSSSNSSALFTATKTNCVQHKSVGAQFTKSQFESLSNKNIVKSPIINKLLEETSKELNEFYLLNQDSDEFKNKSQYCYNQIQNMPMTEEIKYTLYPILDNILSNMVPIINSQPEFTQPDNIKESSIHCCDPLIEKKLTPCITSKTIEKRHRSINKNELVDFDGQGHKKEDEVMLNTSPVITENITLDVSNNDCQLAYFSVKPHEVILSYRYAITECLQGGGRLKLADLCEMIEKRYPDIKKRLYGKWVIRNCSRTLKDRLKQILSQTSYFKYTKWDMGEGWELIVDKVPFRLPIKIVNESDFKQIYQSKYGYIDPQISINKMPFSFLNVVAECLQNREKLTITEIHEFIKINYPYIQELTFDLTGHIDWKEMIRRTLSNNLLFKYENNKKDSVTKKDNCWVLIKQNLNFSLPIMIDIDVPPISTLNPIHKLN